MEDRTARFTILMDPRKKELFERICAQQDLTPSQVVRKLIRQYVIEHLPPEQLPNWLKDPGASKKKKPKAGRR